jgi:xylan 1,4-beta-xylosidase
LPVDFVSTHHYPNDGCGNEDDPPEVQLAQSHRRFAQQVAATRRQAGGKPLFHTEWNTSANSRDRLHDGPYAAAFIVKTVLEASSLAQSYGLDIFGHLRRRRIAIATLSRRSGSSACGIRKPSYRAFELLHALGSDRRDVTEFMTPSTPGWLAMRKTWRWCWSITRCRDMRSPSSSCT